MKSSILSFSLIATLVAGAAFPAASFIQQKLEMPAASPEASITRVVGTCKISVNYSSPGVKGRKMLGGVVPFGSVWRTGANGPTTIEFSENIKFGDKDVAAGKYMLAAIPDRDSWTMILNKNSAQWGVYQYKESEDVARVKVKPETVAALEFLDIRLVPVSRTAVHLEINFETTRVAVPLTVDVDGAMDKKIAEALAASPENMEIMFGAADYYLQSGRNLEKSHEMFQKIGEMKDFPYRSIAVWRRGQVEYKLNKKDAAMKSFDEALALVRENKQMAGVAGEIEAMKKAFFGDAKR